MKLFIRYLPRFLFVTVLSVATLGLVGCGEEAQPDFIGTNITGSKLGQDLAMQDSATGELITASDLKGKVSVVFFGYTQCPDICPTSLSQLAGALDQLGDQADEVNAWLISVDPERDTPEILTEYAKVFSPHIRALTGSPEQLQQTAQSFKAVYIKTPSPTPQQYSMDHSASFYVFDRDGEARVLLNNDATPDELQHDIELLL